MFKLAGAVLASLLAVMPAAAQEKYEDLGDEPEEVIVFGDRFARWDGTRWHAKVQIGFPLPYELRMRKNWSARFLSIEIDTVLACEKRWRRGNKQYEVDCRVEDFGVRGVPLLMRNEYADNVLQEFDTALSEALLQLHVTDDGRVVNVDLENTGLRDIRREREIQEGYRQIMLRVLAGFHMKLPPSNQLNEGQWVEYNPPVFEVPGYTMSGRAGSHLIHQLDKYKGQLVVQSVGKGTVELPAQLLSTGDAAGLLPSGDPAENYFKVEYNGVSLYNKNSGIMTERVWSIRGKATASSQIADGWGGTMYFTLGKFRMLGEAEKVDVGPSIRAVPPGTRHATYPTWKPIDED